MTVLNKLATALDRRDETVNQALADEIVRSNDTGAVRELIDGLSNKDKNIQSDCIKVLYEIGGRAPNLIAGYRKVFGDLLDSKNNRLVWGAMMALDQIALADPKGVYALLDKIRATANTGSVITRDHAVGILTRLGTLQPGRCHSGLPARRFSTFRTRFFCDSFSSRASRSLITW